MSIPFSNTTLRVPRGFGNLLEGLAREVLRNQPKDIPTFAALYFSALLKEREESGLDPAEWGAKLEDRFYNNHAFKQETEKEADGSSEPQREAVETVPENSAADTPGYVEQEVIQPVHISTVSSANFDVLDDVPGVESWGEGGTGGKASEDICAAELAPSPVAPYGGVADVDICAEGLRVPGGLGEFDLTTVVGTPTPLPTPLPVPEEIPTAGSPGSVLLDFRDDEAGQMQDAIPGNAVEETPPRTDAAEQVRGEVPETPEAVLEHGEGQEENEEAAEIDDATKSDLHLKGGNKSGTELQTGEEDPPLGRASPGEEDPPLGRASPGEEDPPLGRTSPGEEDPPLGRTSPGEEDPPLERALGSAREEGSTEEHNDPESFQPQKTCTEEAEATNRDTPPQNSAGMTNTSDDKADDHEDNSKEEAKIDASVADAESDEFSVGDVQAESKENVSISAEQQVAKESEPGRDVGSVGKEQGIESEEQRQGIESEEQDQGIESEEQEQGKDSEEQRQGKESEEQEQGKESEEQEQGKESEEQRQDKESEEQEQGKESEEQEQGRESEEQGQVKNSEDLNQGAESEEQNQGEVLKEQAQNSESEEQTQGEVLEEQAQDAELEEQTQGAELEDQVPAVIPEVNMDEREPKEEREDLLQNMDKRNHSDEQESAQQEEEKVPVGEEGDHKEECSQPQEEEDVMDIPLDDPEANKAAAKIQAGFRGHMTRKKMKDDKPREENQQDQKD